MSASPSQLTAADKILLHLREYWLASGKLEFPANITQRGIADATGLVLTHVPRALKRLRDEGLIREVSGHIEGERRRYKAYFLTDDGMRTATSMRAELLAFDLRLRRGEALMPMKLGEALEMVGSGTSLLDLVGRLTQGGVLEMGDASRKAGKVPDSDLSEAPERAQFHNREEEMRHLESFAESRKFRILAIVGGVGLGKSALVREFAERQRAIERVAWINLHRSSTHDCILARMAECLGNAPENCEGFFPTPDAAGRRAAKMLDEGDGMIILDDYYDVPEETVEFFQAMVEAIKNPERGARLVMTIREDTPSYNRFYGRREVESRIVEELHLRGLGPDDSRMLLGVADIDLEAMKRIYLLTKGSPQALKLIAAGDFARLKETTRFTNEEIRLIMFLKTVRASKK
jgi:DNA-binding MarR family transcriptional regulator